MLWQCDCTNVLQAPYGYNNDGSGDFEDYQSAVHKCWLIRSGNDSPLSLTFARFDTEQIFDNLRIFDGPYVSSPHLHPDGGFSGLMSSEQRQALVVHATGSEILLLFDTDFSVTESGFTFGWTSMPIPVVATDGCALDCLPGYQGDGVCHAACMNTFCQWDKGDCQVEMTCSPGCQTHMIGNELCDIACMTDACNFDARDCECTNVLDEDAGYRSDGTSEREDYANTASRCWLIRPKLPSIESLRLSFQRFDLELGWDFLHVYDGHSSNSPLLYGQPLSGGQLPPALTSSGKEIMIKFTSDETITESGFVFGWSSNIAGTALPPGACNRHCTTAMIGNGLCDKVCMNEGCRWDGDDCNGKCEGRDGASCSLYQLGDGHCDEACMTTACNFDHKDVMRAPGPAHTDILQQPTPHQLRTPSTLMPGKPLTLLAVRVRHRTGGACWIPFRRLTSRRRLSQQRFHLLAYPA